MSYHAILCWPRPRIRLINFLNYRRCCSSDIVAIFTTTTVVMDSQPMIPSFSG
ncbi:hypothetical protein HSR121_0008 [Halapricum desulfuricans]|uniref:Uncharacterized protein n=1 Tax=Halapricum desulfuricans TaxID=2841257 RepID=A0A897MVR9_9EURY|nr:hypothetical protein HSR121_0008 [Halapricum desulfuricans]